MAYYAYNYVFWGVIGMSPETCLKLEHYIIRRCRFE